MSFGAPPVLPDEFKLPNIGAIDAEWQKTFTIVWTSVLAFAVVASAPRLARAIKSGTAFKGFFGITESWESAYQPLGQEKTVLKPVGPRPIEALLNKAASMLWWSLPGLELNAGQVVLIVGYIIMVVLCIVLDANLVSNSNRAGYIALSQLPVVYLFATKNSVLSLLMGPGNGYEKLNFMHKWSGRCVFLGSVLHGALWIRSHQKVGFPILGELKEGTGVAAFAILCVMVLSSLRPVRRMCYEVFNVIHIMTSVAFFITLCYHTPLYIGRWIYPALTFYGLDLFLRMIRMRIKDAALTPVSNQMTLVHIPDCDDGWSAGQHVRLRVFSSGRVFESHPFSIFSAPPKISCITSLPSGINLGVRVMGDWTKALNSYARDTASLMEQSPSDEKKLKTLPQVPVQVMIDGPYGGCSVDLGRYETVLLFAGGAGATFTLGLLDDIVGRCVKLRRAGGEITQRIEFAWCVRSFGSLDWFSPALMDIAKVAQGSDLTLHISVYVTCLCNPEAIPPIPNCEVTMVRPSIYDVLSNLVAPLPSAPLPSAEAQTTPETTRPSTATTGASTMPNDAEMSMRKTSNGGGVAVCASGPEGLTREAANAAARLQMHSNPSEIGPVGLHTEVFAL